MSPPCVSVCGNVHTDPGVCGDKSVSELELQAAISCLIQVLETELGPSAKMIQLLENRDTFPALELAFSGISYM